MTTNTCPGCGRQAFEEAGSCPHCGRSLPAMNGVPDGKLPPDLLAWARQTFDEAEFLAEVREVRETGGVPFEDFIDEVEQRVRPRE